MPISLQVISGPELLRHGITNLSSLQYDVPGLYMNNEGYTHSVYIRGVGNYFGAGAMIGQYIDEADITAEGSSGSTGFSMGDNALYDLNRVEVLKGPQGTLYGDGSMGGVIRYITNSPQLERLQMGADVSELFTQYGAPSQRIETMLNTPVVVGTFGLRFAALVEHDGGWIDEPAAHLKNINSGDLVDARAEARWRPTARFEINAMQIIHRHAYGIGNDEDSSGNINPFFDTAFVPNQTDNSEISNITASYDFGKIRLLSSSTYLSESELVHNLYSPLDALLVGFGELNPQYQGTDQDFSEEMRLGNTGLGPWQWTVGAFYKHFRDYFYHGMYFFGPKTAPLSALVTLPSSFERDLSNSRAVFANSSYTLAHRITFGAGIRYFKDGETVNETSIPFDSATFTSTDPRFFLQYRITPNVNTYVSASKGFRSGGFNRAPSVPYQPEDLWSYDLGTKLRIPAERIRADVDLFYMNYSNFVTEEFAPPYFPLVNSGKARSKGIDAQITWEPADGWSLGLNTEVLSAKFLDSSAKFSGYSTGDRLPFAPKYSFTASVRRKFSLERRPAYLELYYYEISRVQFREANIVAQSDVLHFLNARASVRLKKGLHLAFVAHNLLNDRGNVSPFGFVGDSVRPRPRTFGIEFNMSVL